MVVSPWHRHVPRIGDHMAKECNVSYDSVVAWNFIVVTVIVVVSLGGPSFRESVGLHIDLTLLNSRTCVSFVTELMCALDHSSNAFALAPSLPNRVAFVNLAVCFLLCLFLVLSLFLASSFLHPPLHPSPAIPFLLLLPSFLPFLQSHVSGLVPLSLFPSL